MAKIRNIVRENPLSNFRQVAPDGGSTFRLLAEAMSTAYDRVAPVAKDKMEAAGSEFGREQARKQFGDNSYRVSSRNGDDTDFDFSPYTVEGGARPDAITGLDGGFRGGLAALLDAAPDHIRSGIKIGSAFRSEARQAELWDQALKKYGSEAEARKWVAPPGKSNHNHGRAADLKFASDDVKNWVHQNAGNYGLAFPLANEPWHIEDSGARGGTTTRVSTRNEPGAMVRTSEGRLEARKYSPYAGPILQAHDAAAKVAYQSEVMNKSVIDLMEMSNQYLLDPDGFGEAAQGYIDSIVDQAPTEMRANLSDVLNTEVRRRQMGIMEDKQRDIRARANNSSRALMDRWTDNYAEALVSGDPYEVDAAQRQLDSILQAREALPGVAWTEEQSANVFIRAEKLSEKMMKDQRKERGKVYKKTLDLITEAAKKGATAEGEDILQNPEAVAMFPEEAREAAAFKALRDNLPEFMTMTPAQQAAAVAQLAAAEVSEEWELDVVEAAGKAAKENRKAWDDDSVKRAGEVLANTEMGPPPSLPDLTPENIDKFVEALSKRRDYMNRVVEIGYTDTVAYLSDDEAKSIATLMGGETPPEIRAAMASAIVAGFGPDAATVFSEIDGDPVTMFAGKVMAVGGRPDVAAEMIRGQQLIADGLVQLPPKSDRISAFDSQLGDAFEGIPGSEKIQAELMPAAQALYATVARGVEPSSEDAKTKMADAIQAALGQSERRGKLTGGVQSVLGDQTLLPIGVNGAHAEAAVRLALGGLPNAEDSFWGGMANLGAGLFGAFDADDDHAAAWAAAGSGVPQLNGEPIPHKYIEALRIIPMPDGRYRMELGAGVKTYPIFDADDNMIVFDLPKLMEAME